MQTAPAYRWSCHACGATNKAGVEACTLCGLQASATGEQIAQARARILPSGRATTPSSPNHWLLTSWSFTLFFPEGIGAATVWLASPAWLFSLLAHARYAAALALLLGVGASLAVGYFAFARRSRVLLYVSIVVALVTGLWVNDLSSHA
jgi:hypothetical protein